MTKITTVISPIINILKFLGFLPIFIEKNGNFVNSINFLQLILSLIFWSFILLNRLEILEDVFYGQILSLLGLKLRIVLPYFTKITLALTSFIWREKLREIFRKIDEFNEKVKSYEFSSFKSLKKSGRFFNVRFPDLCLIIFL